MDEKVRRKESEESMNKKKKTPVGARFSAPFQTGPGAHPAFCTVGTGCVSGEVEQPAAWR
jgi:hypothetical protein